MAGPRSSAEAIGHSITSSARAMSVGGTIPPHAIFRGLHRING
jgi:hypothetical protein